LGVAVKADADLQKRDFSPETGSAFFGKLVDLPQFLSTELQFFGASSAISDCSGAGAENRMDKR
jgi:hypothetical protein